MGALLLILVIFLGLLIYGGYHSLLRYRAEKLRQKRLKFYLRYLSDPKLLLQESFRDEFRTLIDWQWVRTIVLSGSPQRKCVVCGKSFWKSGELHIDHIKPRSKYPELRYHLDNLQILCRSCNFLKGAYDGDDWREVVGRRKYAKNKQLKE